MSTPYCSSGAHLRTVLQSVFPLSRQPQPVNVCTEHSPVQGSVPPFSGHARSRCSSCLRQKVHPVLPCPDHKNDPPADDPGSFPDAASCFRFLASQAKQFVPLYLSGEQQVDWQTAFPLVLLFLPRLLTKDLPVRIPHPCRLSSRIAARKLFEAIGHSVRKPFCSLFSAACSRSEVSCWIPEPCYNLLTLPWKYSSSLSG